MRSAGSGRLCVTPRGLPASFARIAPGRSKPPRKEAKVEIGSGHRGRPVAVAEGGRSMGPGREEAKELSRGSSAAGPAALASDFLSSVGRAAVAAGLGCLLLLGQPIAAQADDIVRFPASPNPEIFTVQKTLVEAWTIVHEGFFDDHFNNKNWEAELAKSMSSAYNADNGEKAYAALPKMLEGLGDPYTRVVPPEQYAEFRMTSDGELHGVGMLIALDPDSGRLVVLTPIKGGPADKAGVLPGDQVLSINGESTQGWDGARAAKFLRGKNGTIVTVKLARRTEQIPGVPGIPEPAPELQYREVKLKRGIVELSPVFSTAVRKDDATVGYIKLSSFSGKASEDTAKAIKELETQGAEAFVLDLRDNPGGLVQAGLGVARLWMGGTPTIFEVSGRTGEEDRQVALSNGVASTDRPLVVLVNGSSASASEIVAGALHDNHRATVVGDRTYGKGKIQTVFELQDGSALFLTVAKYQTPAHLAIDSVGIKPDMACVPHNMRNKAKKKPLGNEGDFLMATDIGTDDCFMTAEEVLAKQMHG